MKQKTRDRSERKERHIEKPSGNKPKASSRAAGTFREHRRNESPASLHRLDEQPAPLDEYLQEWKGGYSPLRGGLGAHKNMPARWSMPPYTAPPVSVMDKRYLATRFTRTSFPATYGSDIDDPEASGRRSYCPASYEQETYDPEAYQSARRFKHENPFLPKPYAPTQHGKDLYSEYVTVPTENSTYRRGQFRYRPVHVAGCPPEPTLDDQIFQHSAPEPPPSEVNAPPQSTAATLAGGYQQSPAGGSDIALPYRPAERRRTSSTKQDTQRHGIPSGYDIKNWDPNEKPIFFLGSVFDANSLGKWIYDWTIHKYGPRAPLEGVAGDLWLVLIEFYGKIKKSEEFIDRNKGARSRRQNRVLDMLEEFIDDGKSLRKRLDRLLGRCGKAMLKTAADTRGTGRLGRKAADAFLGTLFGREHLLELLEELKQSMRHWIHDWDVDCSGVV